MNATDDKPAPPPFPDPDDEAGMEADAGSAAGPPRWVTVLAVVAVALVLLAVVLLHLTGVVGPSD